MDSKVSKNTFLHKFVKLHLAQCDLAIVNLLQQQLVKTIDLYQQSKNLTLKKEKLTKLIANTTIVRDSSKQQPTEMVYRCAVALPLAHQFKLPPLEIAEELAQLLAIASYESPTVPYLEFTVRVLSPGWIDLALSDRSLAIWLQILVEEIQKGKGRRGDGKTGREGKDEQNLLPLQYVHARCCSLLRLGHQESLIELKEVLFSESSWQIVEPNPIPWLDLQGNFQLTHPSERRLLVQLFIVVDEFARLQQGNWRQLAQNLSEAMLAFTAECRIWGEVKQQKPQLARARLGIIALVQWYLQKLLQEKLSILAIAEL
ncbi:anticodon-binding protein [Pleurocapsales cyanobacterium LEGE 06147]|nr:anticodon-binding protein [Pleurocapsales cyanobacterium LEGE 06147]